MNKTKSITDKHEKRKGWIKFFVYVLTLVFICLMVGFVLFLRTISRSELPMPIPKADGIVVWTGKGGGRLNAGAQLLQAGRGERLLISGVNDINSREQILDVLDISKDIANCCVDLDYAAKDTVGNARETSMWTQALGYEHIILVTSAYHMPRAEIEISATRGRLRITPYPVAGDPIDGWWKDGPMAKRIIGEYGKLVLSYLRHPGTQAHRGAPVLERPVSETP